MLILFALAAQLLAFAAFALSSPRYHADLTRRDRRIAARGAVAVRAGASLALVAALLACCAAHGTGAGLATFVGAASLTILLVAATVTVRRAH